MQQNFDASGPAARRGGHRSPISATLAGLRRMGADLRQNEITHLRALGELQQASITA